MNRRAISLALGAWLIVLQTASASDSAQAPATTQTPLLWAYEKLIVSAEDTGDLTALVNPLRDDALSRPELESTEFLDYLAEALQLKQAPPGPIALIDMGGRHHENVRLAIIRYLNKHGNGRYHRVILRIAHERELSDAKKLALQLVNRKKTPPNFYVPGTLNLAAVRDAYARDALAAAPPAALAQEIVKLRKNAPFDAVVERLGKPQTVSARLRMLGKNYSQQMNVFYRGVGRVAFVYRNGRGWLMRGSQLATQAYEHVMPYRIDPAKYGQPDDETLQMIQLMSGERVTLRVLLETREDNQDATLEFLDTAAEMLLQTHRETQDRFDTDVNSWICVLLAKHGGRRYSDVLSTVAAGANSEKLVKFAQLPIDATQHAGVPVYRAGSISLAAQRAKYPNPYAPVSDAGLEQDALEEEPAAEPASAAGASAQ
jgi:hypothetical protein